MRPLAFLFVRTFLNGIRRALSSPKRLIGVLFFLGYYWFLFLRPFTSSRSSRRGAFPGFPGGDASVRPPQFEFPGIPTLDAIVFAAFVGLTAILSLGVFGYRGSFKGADVDVLFPTPISPRVVLVFRFLRDYFLTLLTPLFFSIFFYRSAAGTVQEFVRGFPGESAALARNGALAWVLLAVAWTAIGYAVSLLAGRDDARSVRLTAAIKWAIPLLVVAPLGIFAWYLRSDPTLAGALAAARSPLVRGLFFLPTSAAALTLGGITGGGGSLGGAAPWLGGAVLVGTLVGAFAFTLRQADWMYDAAASRGGDDKSSIRELAKRQDYAGIQSLRAQQGKYKKGKLAGRFAARRTFLGARAILWRELVVTLRAGLTGSAIGYLAATVYTPFFLLLDTTGRKSAQIAPVLYLAFTGFILGILAMGTGSMNFVETLRKVDTTKPLPFTPQKVVSHEVLAKSLVPGAFSLVPFLIGFGLRPRYWDFHLTGLILAPAIVFTVMSVVFLVAVLFPDFEDPTQRGFRGMILLLGAACALLPMFSFVAGALALKLSPLWGVPFSLGTGAAVGALALLFAGRLYADYNPSE